jgi:hypothetical protein
MAKKPKKMKSNSFELEAVKLRNEDLHRARMVNVRAGRMHEKTDFSRAREKQRAYRNQDE